MSGDPLLAVAVSGRGLVQPGEPVLAADDEGFTRGRAAFETMRVYGGRPFRFEQHVTRLVNSAERIGLERPDRAEIEQLCALALDHADAPDAVLRLYWTPGRPGGEHCAIALVGEIPGWIEETRAHGQRLVSLLQQRRSEPWLLPATKSTSYAVSMAAEAEAKARGADDAVFVDADSIVLEGPVTNIWWREGDVLVTPSLDGRHPRGRDARRAARAGCRAAARPSRRASIRSSGCLPPTRSSPRRRCARSSPWSPSTGIRSTVARRRPSLQSALRAAAGC